VMRPLILAQQAEGSDLEMGRRKSDLWLLIAER